VVLSECKDTLFYESKNSCTPKIIKFV